MKITKFKNGDIITRIAPSKQGDTSYMGNPIRFIGYKNNVIVLDVKCLSDTDRITLPDYFWMDGWNYSPSDIAGNTDFPEKQDV